MSGKTGIFVPIFKNEDTEAQQYATSIERTQQGTGFLVCTLYRWRPGKVDWAKEAALLNFVLFPV